MHKKRPLATADPNSLIINLKRKKQNKKNLKQRHHMKKERKKIKIRKKGRETDFGSFSNS